MGRWEFSKTRKEEYQIISRAKNGDKGAQEILFLKFQPLIKAMARKRANQLKDKEDVEGDLNLYFLTLVRQYKRSKDKDFQKFIAMNLYYKSLKISKGIRNEEEENTPFTEIHAETLGFKEEKIDMLPERLLLNKCLGKLNMQDMKLIRRKYYEDKTLAEMAKIYRVPIGKIAYRLKKAEGKLREYYNEEAKTNDER